MAVVPLESSINIEENSTNSSIQCNPLSTPHRKVIVLQRGIDGLGFSIVGMYA